MGSIIAHKFTRQFNQITLIGDKICLISGKCTSIVVAILNFSEKLLLRILVGTKIVKQKSLQFQESQANAAMFA